MSTPSSLRMRKPFDARTPVDRDDLERIDSSVAAEKLKTPVVIEPTSPFYSVEIKTSSDPNQIFGNRSYTQQAGSVKKSKVGYYLAINFEPFAFDAALRQYHSEMQPRIVQIRFGWLDLADWKGQTAASGQQARLLRDAMRYKFVRVYPAASE